MMRSESTEGGQVLTSLAACASITTSAGTSTIQRLPSISTSVPITQPGFLHGFPTGSSTAIVFISSLESSITAFMITFGPTAPRRYFTRRGRRRRRTATTTTTTTTIPQSIRINYKENCDYNTNIKEFHFPRARSLCLKVNKQRVDQNVCYT